MSKESRLMDFFGKICDHLFQKVIHFGDLGI